jgi:hypothetical protein
MAVAAITPRVRIMAICDEVLPSDIETDVYTIEGVRQHLTADSFPAISHLCVYMLLSSSRKGNFQGQIKIIDEQSNRRVIRYCKFSARFREDNETITKVVAIEDIRFREPGFYTFEVWFEVRAGTEVCKGELPFQVLKYEG